MSNVNLTKQLRNESDFQSAIDSTQRIALSQEEQALYSDLRLDLELSDIIDRPLNAKETIIDLATNVDEDAVLHALKNVLTTMKCTRLLHPDMDVDIRGFLFEPLTEAKGYLISYNLSKMIPFYEPRVKVDNVKVLVNYDDSSYDITLTVSIPSLKKQVSLKHIFGVNNYSIDY